MKPCVLITGAAGGIGQAIATFFTVHDWTVIGIDQEASKPFDVAFYWQIDLADSEQLDALSAQIAACTTQLDAIIHNAAYQVCQSAQKTSLANWDRVMAVNVRAPFWLTQRLYPLLCAGKGSVVHVASVHALATSVNIAAYAASKGAMVALMRAQAMDFAADGIRVNAVLPGAIDTPMLDTGLTRGHLGDSEELPYLKERLAAKTAVGRIGMPQEVAEAVYFLANQNFMTGQTLIMDGGALARLSTE